MEHHAAGRLSQAEEIYRQILEKDPANPDALHLLGLLAHKVGRHADAIDLIEKAHRLGRPQAVSLNNLGLAYAGAQRFQEAKRCFAKAIAFKADFAEAHANLGTTLKTLGQAKQAERSYRRAATLAPDVAELHYNLGNLLMELGRHDEAVLSYRRAVALQSDHLAAHNNLGRALAEMGLLEEAKQTFRAALAIDPSFVQVHHNLGNVFRHLRRFEDAVDSYRRAIALDGTLVETRLNLGGVLHLLGRDEDAVQCYQEMLRIAPDYTAVHFNLANSFAALGQCEDAVGSYQRAILLDPDHAPARWSLAIAQLPVVHDSESNTAERRAAFAIALDALHDWIEANPSVDGATMMALQPFYLAYQEENNRDLLARLGNLSTTLMGRWREKQRFPSITTTNSTPIKLGVVSAHIRAHSVWTAITKGWLQHLHRARIEFHLFHLGERTDEETTFAGSLASRFEQGPRGLKEWTETILGQRLDVLAYPEIGMHALTTQLASMRLAPIQFASWGHPQTTGLPTIDYYVTADGLEPENANDHYTEQIVRLPNLGCYYDPYAVVSQTPDLSALGIADAPLLLCAGASFKYLPRYDDVLVEIARHLERCQLVFFADVIPSFSNKLQIRLRRAFERAKLNFDSYVRFVPRQAPSHFFGLMERADVLLDTIGFSGFNTAMQAVQCGLPIVTKEGQYMRGRFASAILKRMNLHELVVSSEIEYVKLAVSLASDAQRRRRISKQMQTARDILYKDISPIEALQDFLIGKVRGGSR